MKITLPENISEITLGQYQKYAVLDTELSEYDLKKQTISIFCNIEIEMIERFPNRQLDECYNQIITSLSVDVEFQKFFKLDGIEFGFHPNLDNLTGAEWTDLSKYQNDIDKYHRLMAIFFRPVTNKDKFGNYSIKEYNGTSEYCDKMKDMPLHFANGCLVFFYNLANELEKYIMRYITMEQAKEMKLSSTLKGGVGMLRL